jgi:glycosyltransferase involved in cell wall biosynthesis
MKKVLILAYDFPPCNSIGAQRPYSWFKHFKEFGLFPVVITRIWPEGLKNPTDYIKPTEQKVKIEEFEYGTIIRTPFKPNLRDRIILKYGFERKKLLRKVLTFLFVLGEYFFDFPGTKKYIYRESKKYLQTYKIDLIIVTCEPFILLKYAHRLSEKFEIPWIADYRDGWSTNMSVNYFVGFERFLYKYIYPKLELKYTSNSSMVTTAAPSYKRELELILLNKKIEVVYNGFEREFIKQVPSVFPPKDSFIISYAGTIYSHQQLEMFLAGLKKFVLQNHNAKIIVNFFGLNFQGNSMNRILAFDDILMKFINITDRKPYLSILKELRQSHLLLLLADDKTEQLTAKVFDYLAVERSIILVKNDHAILESIINECNAGVCCEDADDVFGVLKTKYDAFMKGLDFRQPVRNIEKYSRGFQAKIFAEMVHRFLGDN